MKHFVFVSGKRGGLGAMRSTLGHLENYAKVTIIATDQHLDATYGTTVQEVEIYFENVVPLPLHQDSDSPLGRLSAMSILLQQLTYELNRLDPDFLLVYGDRSESLVAAYAALHLSIPIVHFQGGDTSGNIDDKMRHAISHLSDHHLCSTTRSYMKLASLGINSETIHAIGDSHIDPIFESDYTLVDEVASKYGVDRDDSLAIFIMHPESDNNQFLGRIVTTSLNILLNSYRKVIGVYPCSDIGSSIVIDALNAVSRDSDGRLILKKNIVYQDFTLLFRKANLICGNSSAGIIEANYHSTYTLNLGSRQSGREAPATVFHVPTHDLEIFKAKMVKYICKILHLPASFKPASIYGDGPTYIKAVDYLMPLLN